MISSTTAGSRRFCRGSIFADERPLLAGTAICFRSFSDIRATPERSLTIAVTVPGSPLDGELVALERHGAARLGSHTVADLHAHRFGLETCDGRRLSAYVHVQKPYEEVWRQCAHDHLLPSRHMLDSTETLLRFECSEPAVVYSCQSPAAGSSKSASNSGVFSSPVAGAT